MTETPSLGVDIQATPVLSYALAHNRIPVVGQVTVSGVAQAIRGALVSVSISDAQGFLSEPFEATVDLEAGEETTLREVPVRLEVARMAQVEEQRPGTIAVEVRSAEALLGRATVPVSILAANQWLRTGADVQTEVLASFVMPNHPTVAQLLSEASTILDSRTGDPSTQGYQEGEERVDAIADAIFTAAQNRQIRYAEPPASWSDRGQKIRDPGEVFDGRVGTCMDTMTGLAAVLEQAGIGPLLFLVEGHAFLGYWRFEATMQSIVETEPAAVINQIDLGNIALIETTMVTARSDPVTFADVHRPPYAAFLTGDAEKVLGIVDVYAARKNGIIPLPARVRTSDDTVEVYEYHPADRTSLPASAPRDTPRTGTPRAQLPPRVESWKNALLDLSLRNRLINFAERSSLSLSVPDGQLGRLEDIVNESRQVRLLPRDAIDAVHAERGIASGPDLPSDYRAQLLEGRGQIFCDVGSDGYAARMRSLAYKARTIVEETGANNLYLALGSLVWSLDRRALRSPLVLVPIQLKPGARGALYRVTLDESGASVPNFCLLEKLRQVHGLEIPELAEPEADGAGIDLDAGFRAVREALSRAGLRFRVEDTAHVAVLQFAKFRLWKDLDEHWQTFSENALVRHLTHTPTEAFRPDAEVPGPPVDLDELAAHCPVAADASQLGAVADAVAGRTFVLEGPPGTGKSQTITNLLTRSMAEGRRVLFVAEKRAALDVVRRRLDDVGMGAFSLDLHDKGSKPAVVRAQIKEALDAHAELDEAGLSVDGERLRAARQSLGRYAHNLHAQNAAGLSFYTAHTTQLALAQVPRELPVPAHVVGGPVGPESIAAARSTLRDLGDTADLVQPRPKHPWGFLGPGPPQHLDAAVLRRAVQSVDAAVRGLADTHALRQVLALVGSTGELEMVLGLVTGPPVPLTVLDEVRSARWRSAADGARNRTAEFAASTHPGMGSATPEVLSLPLANLLEQARVAAASGFFGRKKRLRAVLDQLRLGLQPGMEIQPKRVPDVLAQLLATQQRAQALGADVAQLRGVALSPGWNPLTSSAAGELAAQVEWLTWASVSVDPRVERALTSELRGFLKSETRPTDDEVEVLRELVRTVADLERIAGWLPDDLALWTGDDGLVATWRATSSGRDLNDPQLLAARRWLSFLDALEPLRAAGLQAARASLMDGRVPADEAVQAFDLGVANASLAERSAATGLDSFDAEVQERSIGRFTSSSRLMRDQMTTALPHVVLANRPFNSANASGRVGALRRELSKRRGPGVRRLMADYGDLVTQVMPCVLVSPDSLSRFFPPQAGLFDLVVFDEASQIRVADAVGAMGRARSVVVVGDSKQMPPSSFGSASLDLGDDDLDVLDSVAVVEDEESILSECVQARVPQKWLSWHYRSQDESLIAFSNALYYEDRLSSFPAPNTHPVGPQIDGVGVSLVRVDGEFQRTRGKQHRTNLVEATRIVDEVRMRFDASPATMPSIGIVTFNVQQRTLIEALLRDCEDERIAEALDSGHEGVFVKNLENVQGDERDLILFSTAFSPDANGRLPLNFGPLNREGGERRLNVAVTRARRQVIVFSSFDPKQLRAEETSSRGVKDLRTYLDMAAEGPSVLASLVTRKRRPVLSDRHTEMVAQALRDGGLVVATYVGLSDFTIDISAARAEAPDKPVLAVLLDGPGWARRGTVGDRDGLPVEVLSHLMRWPAVERVWLPAWLADPEPIIRRLVEAVEHAVVRGDAPDTVVRESAPPDELIDASDPVDGAEEPVQLFAALSTVVPGTAPEPSLGERFDPWVPRPRGSRSVLDTLGTRRGRATVEAVVEEIVGHEGPVHAERLARLVAQCFNLNRLSESRTNSILSTVPRELWDSSGEPFVWPRGVDRSSWEAVRPQESAAERPIEQVSLREIGNAMVLLTAQSAGMETEDLLREANAVFGGARLTTAVRARLGAALTSAVGAGRLQIDAYGIATALVSSQ